MQRPAPILSPLVVAITGDNHHKLPSQRGEIDHASAYDIRRPLTESKHMAGKKKSKFFRIGVEGATCDGRTIERQHIQEMADSYDPAVYGARINMEHIKGYTPDSPFRRFGDVAELKAEEITDGPLKGKLALLASITPTEDLIAMTRAGQKVYTSMEIAPKFADTGKAYLVGLAVTDDPASLGTEMLEFSAKATHNPLASRKQAPDNLFSAAELADINLADLEEDKPSLLDRVKQLLNRNADKTTAELSDISRAVEALAEETGKCVTELGTSIVQNADDISNLSQKLNAITTDFNQLKGQLERESTTPPRHLATGGDNQSVDCL